MIERITKVISELSDEGGVSRNASPEDVEGLAGKRYSAGRAWERHSQKEQLPWPSEY
jgi:hypothetical protein